MAQDTIVGMDTVPPNRVPVPALVGANAVSLVGSTLTFVALPWFVLQTTGSAAKTGLVGFFVALPAFVAGIFGGTLVDRIGPKRASIIADVVSGVGIGLIPLLYRTVGLAFWQLLGLVFLGALLNVPGITARRSLLPELAAHAGMPLERINAIFESNQNLGFLIGPPLAGLLIAWLGTSNVLWLDAGSFAISALAVAAAVPSRLLEQTRAARGRYLDELAAGLRFLRRDRLLLTLAVSLGIANFLDNPLFAVVLPVFAKEAFGSATALGLMLAASGAGQLLGSIGFGAVGHRLRRRPTLLIAFLVSPVIFWALAASPPLLVMIGVLFAVSLLFGPINPILVTVRHERSPLELRGRVFSTFSAVASVAAPLGVVAAGRLIESIGFRPTVLVLAVAAQAIGVGMLFVPALREMDRASSEVAEP